jgi:hypothetical protein
MRRRNQSKGQSMNDDDTDAGGDFFIDMVKVLIALFLFILFVTLLGGIVWSLI